MSWWPWTRIRELERERDQLAFTCEGWANRHDWLAGLYEKEVERNRVLTDTVVQMRRDGFNPPEPAIEPAKDDTPSVVLEALSDRLTPGSREWRQEYESARKKLEQGQDPHEVAKAILKGNTKYRPAGW